MMDASSSDDSDDAKKFNGIEFPKMGMMNAEMELM
jgi:hypothetical protein